MAKRYPIDARTPIAAKAGIVPDAERAVDIPPVPIPDRLKAAYGSLENLARSSDDMTLAVERAKGEMERLATLRLPEIEEGDEAE